VALLFIDGFDHYTTADITKKWDQNGKEATIATGVNARRVGSSYMTGLGWGGLNVSKSLPSASTLIAGFAFRAASWTNREIIGFKDSTALQCALSLNSAGQFVLNSTGNNSTALGSPSVYVLPVAQWHYVECKVTFHNTTGSCIVRVDGTVVLNLTNINTRNGSTNASANTFCWGGFQGSGQGGDWWMDDLYVCDTTGSENNDFLGDCRVDTVRPAADGDYTQFTPSTGTTHFNLVNGANPNAGTYVSDANVGERDCYHFGALPTLVGTPAVYGVQALAAANTSDAGSRSAATFVRLASADHDGAGIGLSTGQFYLRKIWDKNPATNLAWQTSEVDAAQFGVTVTA
jgi:hypothetical protein